MKKWNKVVLISLIVMIISTILCGVFNGDNTRTIWNICKMIFVLTVIAEVIGIIGCIVTAAKNKEKLTTGVIVIIIIAVAIGIIGIIGSITNNEFDNISNEVQNDIKGGNTTYYKTPEQLK